MKGYFDDKNKEYIIDDVFYPRREWLNYLWNDTTVCALDQFGFGTSWSVIDTIRRPIDGGERNLDIKYGERNVYIKDKETGEYYSANRNYTRLPFDYHKCAVGLGYSKISSRYKGVSVDFNVLVPSKGECVQFLITVKNSENRRRKLSVVFQTTVKLENGGHEAYTEAYFDERINGIFYDADGFKLPNEYTRSFISASQKVNSFAVGEDDFIGRYGSYITPDAMNSDRLCSKGSTFLSKYLGVLQFDVELLENQTWQTVVCCGFGKDYNAVALTANAFSSLDRFNAELEKQKQLSASELDIFKVQSSDSYMDSMVNIWLKRQLSLGKSWGRLYGKGFRDVMQDTAAFVSLNVDFARKRIIDTLRHQYEDGNPIRMFEPDMRYPYNDSGTWIPATILAYLAETGDKSILDEEIPFIKGDSYENAKYDLGFFPYVGTDKTYTVFEHLKRAMDYLYGSRGERGLVLFRQGDWNDSLNNVGALGKGESVWATIATVKAYNEFIEILKYLGKPSLAKEYVAKRDELKANVINHGFENGYFIYGYNDFDQKIGSKESEFAKIYLNAQTWATLAEIFDKEKLSAVMDMVEEKLKCPYGYVQNYPAYQKGDDKLGRVSYFRPGLIENGGVYNHGVAFKIVADCMLGRGDLAYETFKMMRFDNPNNKENGVEPYAVSNMYIGPENKFLSGYAPMSWVTGTAGWLYRALTEYILGVRANLGGLKITPSLGKDFNEIKVSRKYRGAIYNILYKRGDGFELYLNGEKVNGNELPIMAKGTENQVKVIYK